MAPEFPVYLKKRSSGKLLKTFGDVDEVGLYIEWFHPRTDIGVDLANIYDLIDAQGRPISAVIDGSEVLEWRLS